MIVVSLGDCGDGSGATGETLFTIRGLIIAVCSKVRYAKRTVGVLQNIPIAIRRTENDVIEFAVAVIIAGRGNIGRDSKRNASKRRVAAAAVIPDTV